MLNGQWLGALLIIGSCGVMGIRMGWQYRNEERMLRQFLHMLRQMRRELAFDLSALPVLCDNVCVSDRTPLGRFMSEFSDSLKQMTAPDAAACVEHVLMMPLDLPVSVVHALRQFGQTMGKLDLQGQLDGLDELIQDCERTLSQLNDRKEERIRSCQTLGFCAGALLAILCI